MIKFVNINCKTMKAKDKVKQIFAPKKKEGGVVIMIGKPSKMKGKGEVEEDSEGEDACKSCGKKGCNKMKCGGKVKKYQEGGKVGNNKDFSKMTPEEKAKIGRERVEKYKKEGAEVVNKFMYDNYGVDTTATTYLKGTKNNAGKIREATIGVGIKPEHYKKEKGGKIEAKVKKGGKVSKMKKGGKC